MLPLNQQMSKRKTTALEQQLADLTSVIGEPAAKKRMAEIIVERMATSYSAHCDNNEARLAAQVNSRRDRSSSVMEPAFSPRGNGNSRRQERLRNLTFDKDDPSTYGAQTAATTKLILEWQQRSHFNATRNDPNDFEHARICSFCGGMGHDAPYCNPKWTLDHKQEWLDDPNKSTVHCQRCGGRFHGLGDLNAKGTDTWCPSLTRQQHAAERTTSASNNSKEVTDIANLPCPFP